MENKSSNTQQVFWVLIGSISAFAFSILSSMLLSRYFNKQDYGTYKQIMYVYSSLTIIFTLGLPRAFSYFLPKIDKGEARDVIDKINWILMALGLIMSLFFFFGAGFIGKQLKNESLILPLKYFSLVPFFMLPSLGLEGIMSTYRQTKFLALYNTLTKVFMLLCVVVPVIYFKGTILSAVIGFTLSSFLCFITSLYFKNRPVKGSRKIKSRYSYKDILAYTIPLMGASLWGVLINSADQFFISRYFGNEIFADFANGSLELPFVGMIIVSTATVLSPVFVKQVHEKGDDAKQEVLKLWRSVLSKTVKIIYPLVIFCFCFADVIMVLLYGEKYHTSGIYFQIKLIVNFFTVITYAPLLFAINGQKFYYNVHMYGAIILIVLEYLVIKLFNSPYLVTATSVLCQIGRIAFMMSYIAKYFKIPLKDLFPYKLVLEIIIPSAIIIFLSKYLFESILQLNLIFTIISSGVVYLIFFGIWTKLRGIDYFSIIQPLLIRIKK